MRILVVDDSAINCRILSVLLNRIGCEVRSADAVESAMRIIDEWQPDFVLTDLHMQESDDGLRLARWIRTVPGGERMKVALMSGDSPEDSSEVSGIFDCILNKPVQLAELQGFIREEQI